MPQICIKWTLFQLELHWFPFGKTMQKLKQHKKGYIKAIFYTIHFAYFITGDFLPISYCLKSEQQPLLA